MAINILVIDDDKSHLRLIEKGLQSENYCVKTIDDAPKGLQTAVDELPDLVILDVMMPVINGYNICKLLKRDLAHKNVSVILLTSRDERVDVELGLEAGADAYLIKPCDIKELISEVQRILIKKQKK